MRLWLDSINCKRPLLIGLNGIWINLNDKWKSRGEYATGGYFFYIKGPCRGRLPHASPPFE